SALSLARLFGLSLHVHIPDWALPAGLSFYTFTALSYVVDVMRKREQPRGFWEIQLYVAFFPKLIAGPILRVQEFLPQLEAGPPLPRLTGFFDGLRQIIIGLFFKVVVADGLGPLVDDGYGRDPASLSTIDVWVLGLAIGFQTYFDLGGYTRIAI